ncbi:MAG: nucleotidyltransferase domain-containing protein, partial [Nanoarchaeota archaeon]|nr:nucleotidyltransferase domain-containing protein [Nanoarchaeota archaeon]
LYAMEKERVKKVESVKELPIKHRHVRHKHIHHRHGVKKIVETEKKKDGSVKELPLAHRKLVDEKDIAMDFAEKAYKKFDRLIKASILFGSQVKNESRPGSDIDIIFIIDDAAVNWDMELIAWYREELGKTITTNPYIKSLHINTVKLSTWWNDLIMGDPVIINILRYGDSLIDFGGFFTPLQVLLKEGKIKSTPEAIYTLLQHVPNHIARTRFSMLSAIDGLYWAMVDSAHAALITAKVMPPSPEHIPDILKETFVDTKFLDKKYIDYYIDLHNISKEVIHGKRVEISGKEIDEFMKKTDDFVSEMTKIVDKLISK